MGASRPTPQNEAVVLSDLIRAIESVAKCDGDHMTAIPALSLYRRSSATEPMHCILGLGVAIVASGKKRVALGDEIFDYAGGQSLLATADLPVIAHVTQASPTEPYLGVVLKLDPKAVMQSVADMAGPPPPKDQNFRAMALSNLEPGVIDAMTRLVGLLGEPELVHQVAPLIQQEIIVRLLSGRHGPQLQRLVAAGSPGQQVTRSMNWLRSNFTQPVVADDLAASAHMSPSTFRQHFRAVAGMSPMQYLKQLRLQEARQLMLNQSLDAGTAAMRVGYESASQFSREYARLFGEPPLRDIKRMRESSRTGEGMTLPNAL